MKLCNSEIMKQIKELETQKNDLLRYENRNCEVTYVTNNDLVANVYDFKDTRNKIAALNDKIRKYKHALNVSNATTIVPEFNMTIGECLVYMAQLNNELNTLRHMKDKNQKSRRSLMNGTVEYTDLRYSVDSCADYFDNTQEEISRLQIAIDRTNLTNMIEV